MNNANLAMLQQAKYIYDHRASTNRQGKMDNAVALHEWGVFSNIAISNITGLDYKLVSALTKKSDHTGGKIAPEAFGLIIKWAIGDNNGEPDWRLMQKARNLGTGGPMLAKLAGTSQPRVHKHTKTPK